MQALGFTTFKYHRWYKLIRDEVLLSFGLVPSSPGFYDMKASIYLIVAGNTEQLFSSRSMLMSSFCTADIGWICRRMCYPDSKFIFGFNWIFEKELEKERTLELFDPVVVPSFTRIADMPTAFKEVLWWRFIRSRYTWQWNSEGAPNPNNYCFIPDSEAANCLCYFKMYEECKRALAIRETAKWARSSKERDAYLDAETALEKMERQEKQSELFLLLKHQDYDEVDRQLQKIYENTLRMIKRRLKLEPDCSDTIWDRDYRHPIDIRQMLQERFDRCAPRAAQGDYTIDFI